MFVTFVVALVSLVATLGYLSIFQALHVLPAGYNPIRHAVSESAIGTCGYLFRVGLWVISLGVVALGILRRLMRTRVGRLERQGCPRGRLGRRSSARRCCSPGGRRVMALVG